MGKQRPAKTWLEVAVAIGGLRKAVRALIFANCWAMAREALGHDPTVEEIAEWWKASVRSTYRDQAAFRTCFPMLETPARIFESPEARARIHEAVAAWDTFEDARSARREAAADKSVLTIGLLTAPADLLR